MICIVIVKKINNSLNFFRDVLLNTFKAIFTRMHFFFTKKCNERNLIRQFIKINIIRDISLYATDFSSQILQRFDVIYYTKFPHTMKHRKKKSESDTIWVYLCLKPNTENRLINTENSVHTHS